MSLAKQLAELDRPAPEDFDPEDVQLASAQVDADPSAGRAHYLEVGPSDLRKSRDTVSDPKYDGIRISRKDLEDDDDNNSEKSSENQPSDDEVPPEPSSDEEEEPEEGSDDVQNAPEAHNLSPSSPRVTTTAPHEDELSSSLKRVREEERKKGKAVARQQSILDVLVDARIRLQKCLTAVNCLPNASSLHLFLDSPAAKSAADGVLREATALADDLFEIQEKLLKVNDLPDAPPTKRRRTETLEGDIDWDDEVRQRASHFSLLEHSLHTHAVSTIRKWSNKVLAVDPSALMSSNRNKFSQTPDGPKNAVQLIDEALLDRTKLLERTREYKGKGTRLKSDVHQPLEEATEEEADDVFDDTDFYQQLLRDVIDARSGNALEGAADDWRIAQKQRKAKKAVDTRASKGRKLRFEVHEKIQNFMAPVLAPSSAAITWHESQIDELFASLLGRGYSEHGNQDMQTDTQASSVLQPVLNDGFRVFG
ncbi:TRAUB-domain-containing protein [Schizopora paradoxa]|uniref:Protein BFR2 n=1 Tax=Schizopora paradoxa TaxID=27342 RepID=A0A0H2S278_9AGAM|nr:TRAUB-domain-containing protein [Schizopora paradoxa]